MGFPSLASQTPKRAVESDLSGEIMRTIERDNGDHVRCARVFDDYYRCNWWSPSAAAAGANQAFGWSTPTTHYIRKSQFINATMTAGQLTIKAVEVVKPEER